MSDSGSLFIVAAPSGAGKTSLVNALVASLDNICISVSYTTRPKRPGDCDGQHYHFVREAQFTEMIADQRFLEYAKVYGYYYGTSRQWVVERLARGDDVILEIDWQGARQVREQFALSTSIFILPPSRDALRERLHHRRQDEAAVINQRMSACDGEMRHYHEFDYVVVNADFERACEQLTQIVSAKRLETSMQQKRLTSLLAQLLQKD